MLCFLAGQGELSNEMDDPINVEESIFELESCDLPTKKRWGRSRVMFIKDGIAGPDSFSIAVFHGKLMPWAWDIESLSLKLSRDYLYTQTVSLTVTTPSFTPGNRVQTSQKAFLRFSTPCVLQFANVLRAAGGHVEYPPGYVDVRRASVPAQMSVPVTVPVPLRDPVPVTDDGPSVRKYAKVVTTANPVDTETRKSSDKALGCPICLESYSLTRYPVVAPECMHSICVNCAKERNSNICVICNTPSYFCKKQGGVYIKGDLSSRLWKKNFDLCALLELNAQDRTVNDLMNCTNCKSKEKRERMKICVTCAEKWNKEWKGMKEEEILPFILCLFCCHEKADHRGHTLANYLPWKLNELLSTTVSNNQATVSSMDELSHFEMERGKACVKMWKKEIDSFRSIDSMKCETYREGLSIVDVLNKECELVTRASEDCLPPLRKYSKIVKESTARIQQLKTGVVEEGIEEDV